MFKLLLSLVTGLFSMAHLLPHHRWSPSLRLHVSHCSTFRIMCDVPSTAVFCSETIECFLVRLTKFSFYRLLLRRWLQLLWVYSYYYYYYYCCCCCYAAMVLKVTEAWSYSFPSSARFIIYPYDFVHLFNLSNDALSSPVKECGS